MDNEFDKQASKILRENVGDISAERYGDEWDLDGLDDDAVYEFKTTSRLDASYIDRLDIDFQVSAYLEAASRLLGLL